MSQSRAIERTTKLRARVKRKANGQDNMLAKVLDWHEVSARDQIKENEAAVSSMERALEILTDYSFADDFGAGRRRRGIGALLTRSRRWISGRGVNTGPNWCDVDVAPPSASG